MNVVSATLGVYRDAAREALRSLSRSWLAALTLLVGAAAMGILGVLVSPLGLVGGFIVGFAQAAFAGVYLFLVEIAVVQRAWVRWSDVQASLGRYVWDVISVLFIFWIGSMVLGMFQVGALMLAVYVVAFVLFNPVPELIYQGSSRSIALLGDATRFIFDNWIEWFIPQVLIVGAMFLAVPAYGLMHLQWFGPFFGFLGVADHFFGSLLGGVLSLRSLGESVFLLVLVHFAMLFRGHLYRELSRGSRRARAWRARMK